MTTESLEENCPAFRAGCPFKSMGLDMSSCTFFAKGCPFKETTDMNELYHQLQEALPDSHHEKGTAATESVLQMFQLIHQVSVAKKADVGACPVFVTTCPFKTLTKNNVPLVDELQLRSWGLFDDNSDDEPEPHHSGHLAEDLKYGTKKSHREAENVHFIREFIKGRINKEAYKTMVAMFYYVYGELEAQMRHAYEIRDPVFTPLHFPDELERKEALEEDLAYYYGANWRKDMPAPTPATKEYLARLHYIGANEPSILVAHAYTRYLGDLSGGQILKRIAIKSLGLENGQGTAFYDFNNMQSSHKAFKDKYRHALDNLHVTQAISDRLVEEANLAFLLNMKIFEELDVISGFNTPEKQQAEAIMRRREESQKPAEPETRKGGVCPFAKMIGQPGIKELAMKYHGDNMSAEEFDELKAEYDAAKWNARKKLLRQYGMSMVVVGLALGLSLLLKKH
ncbi:heme oxygenase [Achlya hypogyna]|uniref:heme oxygenase (biliverdin-producing) n=1 Tax=Achlya hypogyna TaxID=1202772 RepID=A0A1V9YZ69_ACHHY|nr:heme oxygenase [Achlya hypogyna]